MVLRNNVQVGGEVVASCFTSLGRGSLENLIDGALEHPDRMLQRERSVKRLGDLFNGFQI